MNEPATCNVCGARLAAHELRFHNGVAGTTCSWSEADRQYFSGGRDLVLWEYSDFVERERPLDTHPCDALLNDREGFAGWLHKMVGMTRTQARAQ